MTAQIKLKHSGGNGVIIEAPASNPASDKTLTLPSDVNGTIVSKDSSNSLQNIAGINGGQLDNRRLTINGAMQVAQRGVTFNSISTGQVSVDRFRFEHGGSSTTDVINVTQKSNAARDIGFEHSLKAEVATVDSSLASDHYTQFKYLIEAQDIVKQSQYGLSSAKADDIELLCKMFCYRYISLGS